MEKFYPSVSLVAILILSLRVGGIKALLHNQRIPAFTKDPSCYRYEKKIEDYNFGSLIRTDCKDEYSQHNSIFGTSLGDSTTSHA